MGLLNSEESLEWSGPPLSPSLRDALPDKMDEAHFAAVERSLLGLVRCRRRPDRVECALLGLVTVLSFGDPATTVSADGVRRTWRVTGGLLARRGAVLGRMAFAWSGVEDGSAKCLHRLTACVESYPSRFLPHGQSGRPGLIRRTIAREYAHYHGVVTCRFLRRLARWINDSAEGHPV